MRIDNAILAVAFCAIPVAAQQWVLLDGPYAAGRGVAWDSRRQRAVAFGSEGETWEYDGSARLHRPTTLAPFPRNSHAMVYDALRGQTLLFGGTATASVGDTWLWDGCTWQTPFFVVAPPRRSNAGIAFDSGRNRVVLFGGQDISNVTVNLSDTWEYDGTQWLQRTPATVPNPALSPQLAYDSARGVTVLVVTGTGSASLLVFEWNGTDWLPRNTAWSPQQRFDYGLAFDPLRQRTVLFGGSSHGDELWEWDGNAWLPMLATAPIAPVKPGMYFDPLRAAVVIQGGQAPDWQTAIWTWNGVTLANAQPGHSPSSRRGCAVFQDDARNRAVLFGGAANGYSNDTWEWDGMGWLRRTPPYSPSARQGAMACFDPVRATGLLFGGLYGNSWLGDTWRWDGTLWTQLPVASPPARTEGVLAWDGARNEAILFGGLARNGLLGDTWRWNGAAWTQATAGPAPNPRVHPSLAFDSARGRMVLFGGIAASGSMNDTWEWDGAQWQLVQTAQSPPVLGGPSMVYDPVRGRILLVGVNFITPTQTNLPAWEYDGVTWTLRCVGSANLIEQTHLTWDAAGQRVLLFDGKTVRELTSVPADATVLGSGCGAPPPLLSARARPRTGENQFGLELMTRANLPSVFALGFGAGSTSIGNGCTLLVQQVAASSFVLANGNGMAVLPIPLPPNLALRGLVVHAQAGALDPAAPGGLALSQSLRLTVGD